MELGRIRTSATALTCSAAFLRGWIVASLLMSPLAAIGASTLQIGIDAAGLGETITATSIDLTVRSTDFHQGNTLSHKIRTTHARCGRVASAK